MKHESEYLKLRRELMLGIKEPEVKEKKPIAKKSAKRKIDDKEYKKIVDEMLKADNRCELKTPVCTKVAQGLHHRQKRSRFNLTNKSNLLRACNACNGYVETHPIESLKNNLSTSKYARVK